MQVFFANSGVFKLRLQNSRFFLKISKKVKCGVRVLRARSARASHARGAPQSRSLFSTSFQTFCWLLARAWIHKNTDCFEVYSKLSFLSTCSRLANCCESYLIGFPLLYLAFFNCIQDFRSSPSFLVFKTFICIYGYPPFFLVWRRMDRGLWERDWQNAKEYMAGKFTRARTPLVRSTQIEYSSQKMAKQAWNISKYWIRLKDTTSLYAEVCALWPLVDDKFLWKKESSRTLRLPFLITFLIIVTSEMILNLFSSRIF